MGVVFCFGYAWLLQELAQAEAKLQAYQSLKQA